MKVNFMRAAQFVLVLSLVLFGSCHKQSSTHKITGKAKDTIDLPQIRERGKLVAVTDYNSTNYFIYRGQPMGYQFELLQQLADHLGIKLEVIVSNSLEEAFDKLNNGECDLIAENLTVTTKRKTFVDFTTPHSQTRQVLVQRKPENYVSMTARQIDEGVIRNQLDLAEKTIYVQQNSAYAQRLYNLQEEIGDSINVKEVPDETEELIAKVADGEINYTVCDENVAMVNATYYPNIDIQTAISFPQKIAWGVRKGSPELKEEIDDWLVKFKRTKRYALLYNKYFRNQKSASIVSSDYFAINSGKISAYDKYIKKASAEIGWDWRLLASMIYQESRFNPQVRSWAGAYGLMQLMPNTAARFGVDDDSPPSANIYAGVQFIKWLEKRFEGKIKDSTQRIKFVLAAYNAGYGHVLDAQRLAAKYGKNPNVWDNNVDFFMKNKSKPKYYQDPVVKYGYCRGNQPYNYVNEIIDRYDHYKNIIAER